MRYEIKKPKSETWNSLETNSLATEVSRGIIGWNWRIRRGGDSRELSVLEMAEHQQYVGATPSEITDEGKSYQPPNDALCYILVGEEQTGPYTPDQIRAMWAHGQITAQTLYWFDGLKEWFPVRNFCAAALRVGTTPPVLNGNNHQTLGGLLAVLGLIIAGYFFFVYDTTVETESRYITGYGTIGGQRVHNTGLMQNRLLGCVGGLVLTTIGVILVVTAQTPSGERQKA